MSERGEGLVLVGLPGAGKSAVGRLLGQRLGRPFVDVDQWVEQTTGRTPADLILENGEARLRAADAQAVREVCAEHPGAIIATGGGTLIDPLNRWLLWEHGRTVWLDAPDAVLMQRLTRDPVPRPLAPDVEALARRRIERLPFYRAADLRTDATAAPDLIAGAIQDQMARPLGAARLFDAEAVRHHHQGPEYARILFGRDLDREALAPVLEELGAARATVFADEHAARALPGLLAALGAARCRPLEGGEGLKRLGRIGELLEWLSETGAERGDPVIAFGGGTVGDTAGFVAAVYRRGVPFMQVPTTWLAQVDSALGGKVGVNLPGAKNAVGAFWPPVAVIADVAALRHLPRSAAKDGMVESLKAALIGDPALWTLIEERGEAALGEDEAARYAIVERAARVKLTIADRDPTETGERRQLNLGHTLGHALEVESSFRLPHGEAVALGLRAVANLAAMRGAERGLAERIEALLDALAFPRHRTFQAEAVRRALLTDKKRSRGRLRWLLPVEVGRVQEVDDVSEHEVDGMLRHVSAP